MDAPRELRSSAAHALEITWADGSSDAIRFATLRSRCLCAECRSARQQGRAVADSESITLTDVVPCGPNAVQLVFSDGHARGIFPFSYLRELASRGATTAGH